MAIPRNLGNLAQGANTAGVLQPSYGGTGATTLTANNVVLGNGTSAVQFVAPGTNGNVLTSNGTTWTSAAPTAPPKAANVQTFNSSGTWTKPSGYGASARVYIQVWGGGASGGRNTLSGGGGGGGYNERWISLSSLGATETVTIGAGGTARTTSGNGNAGGNSTFGSWITAYGGGGGSSGTSGNVFGGGGGGQLSAGITASGTAVGYGGRPYLLLGANGAQTPGFYTGTQFWLPSGSSTYTGVTCSSETFSYPSFMHGGGGGSYSSGAATSIYVGNDSVWGGGGGGGAQSGSAAGAGGTSNFGGNGGAGSSSTTGTSGTAPGGGGGGSATTSGAGAAGQIIVTVFDGA